MDKSPKHAQAKSPKKATESSIESSFSLRNFLLFSILKLCTSWRIIVLRYVRVSECSVTCSCQTICIPMNYSMPGFSFDQVFQARVLEWVAISYSRGSFQPREIYCIECIHVLSSIFFFSFFYSLIEVEILTSSIELTSGPHNHNH